MTIEKQIVLDEWPGLYSESWKGVIVNEAFAHPAKFSRALIRKIYDHVIAEEWAKSGDRVIDPFGGVALGGFDAMRHGLYWHGCELEDKFVGLSNQNIALWNERFSRMPNWGQARLIQGDSRKLAEVLSAAQCCVSSPPYVSGGHHTDVMGAWNTNGGGHGVTKDEAGYGASEGQLGAMKEGYHSIAISSPPYSSDQFGGGGHKHDKVIDAMKAGYGKTEGQLGAMPEGQICITSPPYEAQDVNLFCTKNQGKRFDRLTDAEKEERKAATMGNYGYRNQSAMTSGQLSAERGETFWSASRLILEQLYQVLTPNAHAVFVVKAFVRDKRIVDFPAQWAQLCEAVGFKLLHDHHALLTEHYGTQGGFHEDKKLSVERKSFFRRLAEAKGSPRIDYENVLCFKRQ